MSELDPDRPEPGLEEEDDEAGEGKFGPDADDDKFGPDTDDDEAEEQFGTEGNEE